jgi:hypothetical protein
MPHELREYSLADIHTPLSAIATQASGRRFWGAFRLAKIQIDKSNIASSSLISPGLLVGITF